MPASTLTAAPAAAGADFRFRRGVPADAEAVAALIASFRHELTLDPSGAGAESYLASVSAEAERGYLGSERYVYVIAEDGADAGPGIAGFIAVRDRSHVFHLFVARAHQRHGLARRLWLAVQQVLDRPAARHAFTVNSSLAAVPVYRAFGFSPVGEVVVAHGIAFQPMRIAHDEA